MRQKVWKKWFNGSSGDGKSNTPESRDCQPMFSQFSDTYVKIATTRNGLMGNHESRSICSQVMYELHICTNGWWFRSISIRLNMFQLIFYWRKLEANLINFEPISIMKSMNCASNDQSPPFILASNSIEIAANFSPAKTACSAANFSAVWNLKQIEENFLKRSITNFHPCTPLNRFNILGKLWEN